LEANFDICVGSFEWGYPESSPEKRFQNVKLRELPNSYQQKEEKTDENCRPNRDGILKHGLITRRNNQDMESSQRASTKKSKYKNKKNTTRKNVSATTLRSNANTPTRQTQMHERHEVIPTLHRLS